MRPFKFSRASDAANAVQTVAANPNARFLAGGTNLIDLMKEDVERPDALVDIAKLNYAQIKNIADGANKGGVTIGATAKNTDTANHPLIRQNYPLLTQAILAGASGQIRNMATNGGNLNQRTRCSYFYDVAMPCNKREPGTGCGALEGINRNHAIFGWSEKCVATHPSDMCIALVALDAVIKVQGKDGAERSIPFADYHRLPGDTPQKDNNLNYGELITAIEIPKNNFAAKSYYLKVRDRASYAFALVSVAAALEMNGDNINQVRIALGGVSHKPWRATEAEKFLTGKAATEENFKLAAEAEMKRAKPLEYNAFKVELGRRAIVRALTMAMNGGKFDLRICIMKLNSCGLIFAIALLILFSVFNKVEACSCFPPTLQEAVENTPTIIIAKMQSVEKAKAGEKTLDEDGIKYSNFVVQKVYKGNLKVGQTLKLEQGICCNCVMGFLEKSIGIEFLFFIDKKAGKGGLWKAIICSRSNSVKGASADLMYLNRLAEVKGKTRLFGTITQEIKSPVEEKKDIYNRLESHSVKIIGNGNEIELETDKNGVYEVYDLPAGKYKITPAKINGFKFNENEFEEVEIKEGELKEQDFDFEIDNSISGKFFNAKGKPLQGVGLDLLPVSGKKAKYFFKSASTNEDGNFEFKDVPIGIYFIVVNEENEVTAREPFGIFYYPNTTKKEMAKTIKIEAGDYIKDIIINAPTTAETIIVNGILKFEDGKPVANEYVKFFNNLSDINKVEKYKSGDSSAKTDENGNFKIKILRGQKGILFGEFSTYKDEYKNCPKLEKLINDSKQRFIDVKTSTASINADTDISGIELKFSIPKCAKAK